MYCTRDAAGQVACLHPTALPPTSEDCNTIVAAVTILNGSVREYYSAQAPSQRVPRVLPQPLHRRRDSPMRRTLTAAPLLTAANFDVDPNHAQTLTFGTCRFAFQNFGASTVSFCWLSLVRPLLFALRTVLSYLTGAA